MDYRVLALNPGSSTLKLGVYCVTVEGGSSSSVAIEATGLVDRIGSPESELRIDMRDSPATIKRLGAITAAEAAEQAIRSLPPPSTSEKPIDAVGCRVVHGGSRFEEPTLVSPEVLEAIHGLSALAPLHDPVSVEVLQACLKALPETPAVAVFDTAFHRTLPEVARTYALPRDLSEQYVLRRYGFHGIAHRYVSEAVLDYMGKTSGTSRLITCHLGSGASICAIKDGKSIDTSMGMTPMEGLPMSTRSGDVDPGLMIYLMRETGISVDEMESILNRKSGLLGISGKSGDVRDLEAASSQGDTRSELALQVFAYRAAKTIGAYAVVLDGVDAIAFSGGIGEHSNSMRERICRKLGVFGVMLDGERNRSSSQVGAIRISSDGSAIQVWVVPVDEGAQIAKEVVDYLRSSRA